MLIGMPRLPHDDLREAFSLVDRPSGIDNQTAHRLRVRPAEQLRQQLTIGALRRWRGERADLEYVCILHLSATTMKSDVDRVLRRLLQSGESFDYAIECSGCELNGLASKVCNSLNDTVGDAKDDGEELVQRVEVLEKEVRDLRRSVEEQADETRELAQRLGKLETDQAENAR